MITNKITKNTGQLLMVASSGDCEFNCSLVALQRKFLQMGLMKDDSIIGPLGLKR